MTDKNSPTEDGLSATSADSPQGISGGDLSGEKARFSPLAKRFLWADSTSSVERVILYLGILCGVLFILDFIVHRHAYAPGEGLPGFYAVVGFVAFTLIVLGASQLRRLILRNENYYSPNSVDAESYPEAGLERLNHLNHMSDNEALTNADSAHDTSTALNKNDQSSSGKTSTKGDST